MQGFPTISGGRMRGPCLAAALSALAGAALAEPPPFLPPSLQKIVEEAQERDQSAQPREGAERASFDDLRDVAAGDLTLGQVIEMLGEDDLATRDRASSLLADVAMWDEDVLARACALPGVCPEARARLRAAIYERFQNSPRPAVGIQMATASEFGVRVAGLQPGFPSGKVLRVDDEILMIGDVDLRPSPNNQSVLVTTIASYDPGDVVPMLVLRDARELRLDVPLGRFEDLGRQSRPPGEDVLRRALTLRMHRLGYDLDADTTPTIAAPISRFDWKRASSRFTRPGQQVELVAGGEASSVPGRPHGGLGASDPRGLRVERGRDDFRAVPVQKGNADDAIELRIREIDEEIAAVTERINDPRTTQAQRAVFRQLMNDLAKQRQQLVFVAVDMQRNR